MMKAKWRAFRFLMMTNDVDCTKLKKEKNNPNNNNGSNNLNECCRGEDHPVVISRTEAAAAKYWGKMKEYLKGNSKLKGILATTRETDGWMDQKVDWLFPNCWSQ